MPAAECTTVVGGDSAGSDAILPVTNLQMDLVSLGPLLEQALNERLWIDAFLVAAGINQIVEDSLHDAPYPFDQAASSLDQAGAAGRLAGRAAAVGGIGLRWMIWQRRGLPRALAWQQRIAAIVDELADVVIGGSDPSCALSERAGQLALETVRMPAALRGAVIRLPACFHNFDQRPADLVALAERFADRSTGPRRPLLVVGIRTSGSYLAPLLAAAMRALGRDAQAFTVRPGTALLRPERTMLRALAQHRHQVVLIDDPPVTGASIAASAALLRRQGFAREALTLALALDSDSERLPPALAGYAAVTLPAREWSVHRLLEESATRSALEALLGSELELRSVQRLPLAGAPRQRGHRRALFRVDWLDRGDGSARSLDVLASAVGLGYLGSHELSVLQALTEFTPRVLGLRSGILYREWLASEARLAPDTPGFPEAVAGYVAARRTRLAVARDASMAMRGHRPVWEVAGVILGRGFGRAAPVARVLLADRAARRLLTVARPSVIDGSMTPEHWFRATNGSGARKVALSTRTYWNLGLACNDATFDLVGAGAGADGVALVAALRDAWLHRTGEQVSPERWLLYELAHQWGRVREDRTRDAEVQHACARAAARYFADVFLADLPPDAAGPLCALDIDGVMESQQLGFPAMTRASATALRALIAHGHRPVPVTGRGVEEVRDRCRTFGLVGGVAEYGSAIILDGGARTVPLLDQAAAAAIERVRAMLAEDREIQLDPAYLHAVRAFRTGRDGGRRPLEPAIIEGCVRAGGGPAAIRVVAGDGQTDFIAATVDKGTGLRALVTALGEDQGKPGSRSPKLALVVGDTAEDAPMLAMGCTSFVPAHASDAALSTGARRVSLSYQAGFEQAVGELLRHRPGTCERCRPLRPTADRELLLDLMSITEAGSRGAALRVAKLASRLR